MRLTHPRILVTDGNNRVALAVARALGRAGWRVHLVEQEAGFAGHPPAAGSRYVDRFSFVPPVAREEEFVRRIADLAESCDMVLPISTNVILTLARHRDRFAEIGRPLPIPGIEIIRSANRKDRLVDLARELGIPSPQSRVVRDLPEAESVAGCLPFPLAIKLRDDEGLYLDPARRYRIVRTREELIAAFDALHALKNDPMVQEYVDGDGYGLSAVCWEGEILSFFCHRRIREYPASGGPSSLCASVFEPVMIDYSSRLLKALRWHGAAMVEFKRDRRTGEFKIMEINPRFAGSLPLAEAVGVNLPDILARRALGLGSSSPGRYRRGGKMRFFFLDCAAVLSALGVAGKRMRYLAGFVRDLFDPEIADGIFSWSDLRPGVDYIVRNIGLTIGRSRGPDGRSADDVE